MRVRIAQLIVSKDLAVNKGKLIDVINTSQRDEWVIFPEGMLSGYYSEKEPFLTNLDRTQIENAIQEIQEAVARNAIHCIFGTALYEEDNWYNSAIYLDNPDVRKAYKKVNLATLERKDFVAGNTLNVFRKDTLNFGIQICRESAFPEQWKVLKKKGAQVIFHINNAIKENDIYRKHVLISRAFENQYFVVSVNNAATPQTLPSLVVSPFGEILFESKPQKESINVIELNLLEVRSDYLNQERTDLVDVVYKG